MDEVATTLFRPGSKVLAHVQNEFVGERLVLVPTPSGVPNAVWVPTLSMPKERLEPYITQMVKGLLTSLEPGYDFSADTFRMKVLGMFDWSDRKMLESVYGHFVIEERGSRTFQFGRLFKSGEDFKEGCWILVFFEKTAIVVQHGSGRWAEVRAENMR